MDVAGFLRRLNKSKALSAIPAKSLLSIVAAFYHIPVFLRNIMFFRNWRKSKKLPAVVISVGNITTGGTGKTPAVMWLTQKLAEMKFSPVILSRGYGNDERIMIEDMLPTIPHYVHSKRYIAGLQALKEKGKDLVFVLDDGFQHRQLYRDFDIVLIDATEPFGMEHLLPRGFLREPLSYLRLADIILLTKCDQVIEQKLTEIREKIHCYTPEVNIIESCHRPVGLYCLKDRKTYDPASLSGCPVYLFSGIGNPQSFYTTVANLGAIIVGKTCFADHHQYLATDVEILCCRAKNTGAEILLTTSKDLVKLENFLPFAFPLRMLDIRLDIVKGEDELIAKLQEKISDINNLD